MGFHTKSQTIIPQFVYRNTDPLLGALAVDEGYGEMVQAIRTEMSQPTNSTNRLVCDLLP